MIKKEDLMNKIHMNFLEMHILKKEPIKIIDLSQRSS